MLQNNFLSQIPGFLNIRRKRSIQDSPPPPVQVVSRGVRKTPPTLRQRTREEEERLKLQFHTFILVRNDFLSVRLRRALLQMERMEFLRSFNARSRDKRRMNRVTKTKEEVKTPASTSSKRWRRRPWMNNGGTVRFGCPKRNKYLKKYF